MVEYKSIPALVQVLVGWLYEQSYGYSIAQLMSMRCTFSSFSELEEAYIQRPKERVHDCRSSVHDTSTDKPSATRSQWNDLSIEHARYPPLCILQTATHFLEAALGKIHVIQYPEC